MALLNTINVISLYIIRTFDLLLNNFPIISTGRVTQLQVCKLVYCCVQSCWRAGHFFASRLITHVGVSSCCSKRECKWSLEELLHCTHLPFAN